MVKTSILVAFFLSTLWLVAGVPFVFNSPDENANFVFANQFSQTGNFFLHEPVNQALGGLIHSRSSLAIGEHILPSSFFGLPFLAGAVGGLFGPFAMLLVTPALAVFAVIAWRQIVYRLFQHAQLADVSALFLMIHPAFWHYSGRTMMHNVAFVAFLIFGIWFFVARPWSATSWRTQFVERMQGMFAGGMIGFAIALRTSEVLWVLALVIALFWVGRAWITKRQVGFFCLGFVLALVPFAFFYQTHFGSPFTFGYTVSVPETSAHTELMVDVVSVESQESLPGLLSYLFPFGIHEMNIVRNTWNYGFKLYPWMSGLALIGLILALRKKDKTWTMFLVVTLGLSVWLALVYGSWSFADNPDPTVVSLANSHVRYWLPLFVCASIFSANSLLWFVSYLKNRLSQQVALFVLASGVVMLSGWLVFFGQDGFVSTRENLFTFAQKRETILRETGPDAIVIVDRADKFLFPDRRIVTPLRSNQTYGQLAKMSEIAPVYYFGITLPEEDVQFLQESILDIQNLTIIPVQEVLDETLYEILEQEAL